MRKAACTCPHANTDRIILRKKHGPHKVDAALDRNFDAAEDGRTFECRVLPDAGHRWGMFMSIWIPINGTSRTLWNAWHIAAHCSAARRKWWPEPDRLKGSYDRSLCRGPPFKIESRGSFFIISYFHKAPRLKEATPARYFIEGGCVREKTTRGLSSASSYLFSLYIARYHKRDTPIYIVQFPAYIWQRKNKFFKKLDVCSGWILKHWINRWGMLSYFITLTKTGARAFNNL